MIDIIVLIIFLSSLAGMGVIIFRKIPVLSAMPETVPSQCNWLGFFKKIKILNPLKRLSSEIILQKILSKVRVLSLKTDHKTSNWLKKIRTKAKIRKNLDAHYWEEIKKSTKEE